MQLFLKTNIKFLRKSKGITQDGLASQLGKVRTTINNWERGVSTPNLDEIEKMTVLFDVSGQDLLFKDLTDVHPNGNSDDSKNDKNVHVSVHSSIHAKDKKDDSPPPESGFKEGLNDIKSQMEEYKELVKTLSTAVKALDASNGALTASNAQLVKDVEKLESIIRLIKHGIPEVGGGSAEGTQKAVG